MAERTKQAGAPRQHGAAAAHKADAVLLATRKLAERWSRRHGAWQRPVRLVAVAKDTVPPAAPSDKHAPPRT